MIHLIAQSTGHSVRRISESLQVPRSSYYHAAPPTASQRSDVQMSQAIGAIFHQHRRRYGYRRIWKQLDAEGIICAPDRVRRLMQEQGLIAIQPKTYVPQTSDGRADLPSPNLLLDQPLPRQPNQVWAGDITFIPCGEKWLYLAVVIDLCSRRIVGWALADHLRSELVVEAMKQAIASRRHTSGIMLLRYAHPSGSLRLAVSLRSAPQRPRQPIRQPGLPRPPAAPRECAKACLHAPTPITTPGPSRSWVRSKPRCYKTAASSTPPMPVPKFSRSSTATTIPNDSTPPSTTEHPATSRPISPSQTKSLLVQLSVASQVADEEKSPKIMTRCIQSLAPQGFCPS